MKNFAVLRISAALLIGLLALSGCGSLLGGGARDDLFRFGVPHLPARPSTTVGHSPMPRTISLLRVLFAPEIEGDRILTTQGARALYMKDARWVASVPELFVQALGRQFGERVPTIRLAPPGSATGALQALQISIDRFEARYPAEGAEQGPPAVIITGDATLLDLRDRQPIASRRFTVEEPVTANSKSGIVAAFDRAVARYATQFVDWTIQASGAELMDVRSQKGQNNEQ
ncbi:ABC-type transport auxiliary lipoprotein family protein [Sphingobium sp. PNB]|uniref:ABC-type transport auxiliary lipoprotein family protein n=1 Tax=Sphingobium sp. PNB TaxID=863934 RepID=UPI001CA44E77|nr:ABC-type transport auxiliary lipoprotein family protein [Sphingobium sp. PNB]MCB4860400.1 ABC-type transport auxiliary lipoprotein family protein [Sphingobium sp. PNB]